MPLTTQADSVLDLCDPHSEKRARARAEAFGADATFDRDDPAITSKARQLDAVIDAGLPHS